MPITKTGYWVRISNGQVKDVWDYQPTGAKWEEPGWTSAVEIFPDLVEGREVITNHTVDITKDPVEIVWEKRELSIEERKDVLKGQARAAMEVIVKAEMKKETDADPNTVADLDAISSARTTYQQACTAIDALTTHEEVDAYGA